MSSSLRKTGSTSQWRKIREMVFKRDGRYCSTCLAEENLTIDHIVERSKGGTDHLDNLRVLCNNCNIGRNKSHRGFFLSDRTPPTPHGLISPRNRADQTSSSQAQTESVSHG